MIEANRRIVVVANKSWEADPLVNVILHERGRPPAIDAKCIKVVHHPWLMEWKDRKVPDPPVLPRVTFSCQLMRTTCGPLAKVDVWCLQDLMNPRESGSSSLEKWRVLPRILAWGPPPDLVIAFGTAGIHDHQGCNGSVAIGTRVFVYDAFADRTDRTGLLDLPATFSEPLASPFPTGVDPDRFRKMFRDIEEDLRYPAEGRFLLPPVHPARPPLVFAGHGFVSLGIVNVTNYDDYVWADPAAKAAFEAVSNPKTRGQIGSVETTHGLVRMAAGNSPFVYISGLTDRVGSFDLEVTPRVYGQNFVAAHNAGIAAAWFIPAVANALFGDRVVCNDP